MELPIDHFRLLGVSATTDAQAALQMLQQRLDRVPRDGYSLETLDARAELLRSSAELLSDSARRSVYESDLTALSSGTGGVIPALDIPASLEVGGLLLLLEAGQPLECFELASRSLQPPRAPALGSSRESDLTLVAAQAALAGAHELETQRRYEAAAQTLLQGQQLLQRMGQLPRQRQQLSDALNALTPYRVLDLLSRPLTATAERSEGLRLLAELVQQRGGLEGSASPHMSQEEFQTFFKQIRSFLTVQEQVDLFTTWAETSPTADFLATTALTASGFVQRKPERIAAALSRLEASSQSGTDTLKAALALLLGQVDRAQTSFEQGATPELLSWASLQSSDPLAQLCAYCADWLQRDVLPGYRDLEAEADLDAYFADRDVQAFIEANDPASVLKAEAVIPAEPPAASSNPFEGLLSGLGMGGAVAGTPLQAPLQTPPPEALLSDEEWEAGSDSHEPGLADQPGQRITWTPWRSLNWPQHPARFAVSIDWSAIPWSRPPLRLVASAALGAGLVTGAVALVVRQPWRQPQPLAVQPASQQVKPPVKPPVVPPALPSPPKPELPLTAAEPSEAELRALLEAWLSAKAAVLAGGSSQQPLDTLARNTQVQRLQAERSSDSGQGQTQKVSATISTLEVLERSPNRIVVRVKLNYSDSRLDSGGTTLERTEPTTLVNRYVLARDGQTWRLAAFSRDS